MKVIRQKVCSYAIATGFSVILCITIFLQAQCQLYTYLFLVIAILVSIFLSGFLLREYRNIKTARLIIENKILYIKPAQIYTGSCNDADNALPVGGIEVFISCFGILLDSKVIKFNLEGIHLKKVEIGQEFICLSYGKDMQIQTTRILHGAIGNQEQQEIVERFHYETGVVPEITVW